MYGNTINESYEQNIANEVESTIKTRLDSWYKENIFDKNLSDYIADSGFCNDRSLYSGDGVSVNSPTNYSAANRRSIRAPILTCPNANNDLFTVDNINGNQALTYPIGLITLDELMFAGMGSSQINTLSYIFSGARYWTMTPAMYNTNYSSGLVYSIGGDGRIYNHTTSTKNNGIRPVINLASTVEIESGIGTANDPYVLSVK